MFESVLIVTAMCNERNLRTNSLHTAICHSSKVVKILIYRFGLKIGTLDAMDSGAADLVMITSNCVQH